MRDRIGKRVGAMAIALVAAAVSVSACGGSTSNSGGGLGVITDESGSTGVTVSDVWARPGSVGGSTGVYFDVAAGGAQVTLTGVRAPEGFADSVEMHETVAVDAPRGDGPEGDPADAGHDGHDSGGGAMMTMQPVPSVVIPADDTVSFSPGGLHVMVTGLHADLVVGDTFPVTFTFEPGGEITVVADVHEP